MATQTVAEFVSRQDAASKKVPILEPFQNGGSHGKDEG